VEHIWQASTWSTPRATDGEKGGPNQSFRNGAGLPLPSQAFQWPTPSVADTTGGRMSRSGDRANEPLLKGLAPIVSEKVSARPTPAVTDSNGARNRTSGRSDPNSKHHDGVTLNDAILLYSLPDPTTSTHGVSSSTERRTLNPLFVEWLMGWPPGWTDFACSATALSRWKAAMRSALSQLASPSAAPPAQLALFG
jgi:hypothetical protein